MKSQATGEKVPSNMALKSIFILAIIGFVYSQSHCSAFGGGTTDGEDCSCADRSFNECSEPSSTHQLEVANLAECKSECDILATTVGACDWFIFDQTGGGQDNCKLFGAFEPEMSMDAYLGSCKITGGPLRNEEDACFVDPEDPACNNAFCPGGCVSCAGDRCNGFVGTGCTPTSAESSTTTSIPSVSACQSVMTMQGISNIINYFTFDQGGRLCKGYPNGRRFCNNIVAAQTMDLDDLESCQTWRFG